MNMIFTQILFKQEELVEIIDTTGTGSLVFGEEYEVMDLAWSYHNNLRIKSSDININVS